MEPIVFKKMVHIQVGGVRDWIVETQTIDGVDFIELRLQDQGFSRYVTGNCRGMTGMQFLDELRVMRKMAVDGATGCSPDTTIIESRPSKYQCAQMQKRFIAEHGMPDVVDVQLPAVTFGDLQVHARTMKLKASTETITVELNEGNLQYIKLAMLAGRAKEPANSVSNLSWRPERNAYVAGRSCSSTGKKVYKTFKISPGSDKDSERGRAVQWLGEGL
jgi:hypothetical protein